jgi:hypothetical protein
MVRGGGGVDTMMMVIEATAVLVLRATIRWVRNWEGEGATVGRRSS